MPTCHRSLPLLPPSDVATVVIAMEVLDNLPHDKIQAKTRKGLAQAEIHTTPNGGVEETFVPLNDPLLSRVVGTVPSYAKAYPTWVPSVACGVIEHLVHQRPNLGLVVADFDWLPAPDLGIPADETRRTTTWAESEPLITDMKGMDYECFLQAPPYCDILFPTDFDKLRSFTMHTISSRNHRGNVRVEKQADFLERYGSSHVQKTKSWLTGYTPLLQDFVNCSVLTITTASGKVANK
jgi:Putative S-adenosyl-L-methionine-dependent methyltransferase